jgi:hypothetical protein
VETVGLELEVGQPTEARALEHPVKEIMVVQEVLLLAVEVAAALAESVHLVQVQEVTVVQEHQMQFPEQLYIMQEEQAVLQED